MVLVFSIEPSDCDVYGALFHLISHIFHQSHFPQHHFDYSNYLYFQELMSSKGSQI